MAPRDAAPTSNLPPRAAPGSSARIAWFETIGAESERDRPAPGVELPAPDAVQAIRGRGQVSVAWSPVEDAAGYLVHRSDSPDGTFEAIDQGGGDVLAVPHGPYLDTTGGDDRDSWYAVSSVPTIEAPTGRLSVPVSPEAGHGDGAVVVLVDAGRVVGRLARPWRPIIGSEHLALLLRGAGPGGHDVGEELAEAFRIVRRELGSEMVRAHGWLHDSLEVYREEADGAVHDFTRIDDMVDRLLSTGLRPIVELSFMPRALASDPGVSVFDYVGIISPPRDVERWSALVRDLVAYLADRYGRDEVRRWAFEVWNEPNLRVFWSASESDYFALYDASVRAVKSVDASFRVGGPATAAAGWVDDLLEHCRAGNLPLDFISTHTYGMPPLDLRPVLARYDRSDLPLWWTEWGVSPRHGAPINDSAWAAPLVARGMRSAAGRLDALAYWVASDHFVELGVPEKLFHGGFGLLTIGNLRKPRFWAIAILEQLGTDEVTAMVDGDGAGSMVEAWASRDDDGRIAIAVWNGTLDQSKADGDPDLDRAVTLRLQGLEAESYEVRHRRVDRDHSNIVRTWEGLGRPDWPSADDWERLRAADTLVDLEPATGIRVELGQATLAFDLPMPGISLIELTPAR